MAGELFEPYICEGLGGSAYICRRRGKTGQSLLYKEEDSREKMNGINGVERECSILTEELDVPREIYSYMFCSQEGDHTGILQDHEMY